MEKGQFFSVEISEIPESLNGKDQRLDVCIGLVPVDENNKFNFGKMPGSKLLPKSVGIHSQGLRIVQNTGEKNAKRKYWAYLAQGEDIGWLENLGLKLDEDENHVFFFHNEVCLNPMPTDKKEKVLQEIMAMSK